MDILTATKLLDRVFCLPFPIALTSQTGHPSSDLDQEVPPSGSSALSPLSPPWGAPLAPFRRGQCKDRDPLGTGGREGSSNVQESLVGSKSQSTLSGDENLGKEGLQTSSFIKVSKGERAMDKAPKKKAGNVGVSGTGLHMLAPNLWAEWKTRKKGGLLLKSGPRPAANCKGTPHSPSGSWGTGMAAGWYRGYSLVSSAGTAPTWASCSGL